MSKPRVNGKSRPTPNEGSGLWKVIKRFTGGTDDAAPPSSRQKRAHSEVDDEEEEEEQSEHQATRSRHSSPVLSLAPEEQYEEPASENGTNQATASNSRGSVAADDDEEEEDSQDTRVEKPKPAEWKKMKEYKNCSVTLKDNSNVRENFKKGDIVYVLAYGEHPDEERDDNPNNVWIARLQSIKSRPNKKVWCKINWFYTRKQFFAKTTNNNWRKSYSLDQSYMGNFELIETDHEDHIEIRSIDGHAEVILFDERDVTQAPFSKDDFFVRVNYTFRSMRFEPRNFDLTCKVGGKSCGRPYHPDRDMQFYCPRCKLWYHDECMEKAKWTLTPSGRKKLASSPEELIATTVPPETPTSGRKAKRAKTDASKLKAAQVSPARSTRSGEVTGTDAYQLRMKNGKIIKTKANAPVKGVKKPRKSGPPGVPAMLMDLAGIQIVRGGEYGVAGNVKPVLAARRILVAHEAGTLDSFDGWEEDVGKDFLDTWKKLYHDDELPPPHYYICGGCQSVI